MKYLVTGGAGFIGSNIADRLIQLGHEPVIIDDFSTGSYRNLPSAVRVLNAPYSQSLRSPFINDVAGIFHLGAPSNTLHYRDDPALVGESIRDFSYILNFAVQKNIKVVYASTSSMYRGNPVPWHENMKITPFDFYTESRYSWERMASVYHQHRGAKAIGLRAFSVYGQHELSKGKYANIVTQLYWAKLAGTKFEIWGDGSQMRDTIHVNDVVDAYMRAMLSPIDTGIFNVGTGESCAYSDIAKMIGTDVKYVKVPIVNYIHDHRADTRWAEKQLGFKAKISLAEGLELLKLAYGG